MLFEAQGKYYISNECCLFILKRKIDPREPKIVSNKKTYYNNNNRVLWSNASCITSGGRRLESRHHFIFKFYAIFEMAAIPFLCRGVQVSPKLSYHRNVFFVMASGGFILLFTSQFTVPSNEKLYKSIYHRAFIK